jgi:iron(III) transport system permease protein
VILALILLLLTVVPIGRMVVRALTNENGVNLSAFGDTANEAWFWPVIWNTVTTVVGASLLALVIGSVLAWLNERTDASLGWVGTIFPLVPMIVPGIAMSAGWVFLASPRTGFINYWLSMLPWHLEVNILTRPGLIFVYTLALVPFTFVIVASALKNLDPALEEASIVSGAGLLRTIFRISLPAVSHAMISAFFLMLVMGFSLFSIPITIGTAAGIDILSVRLVHLVSYSFPPDIQSAAVLASVLLTFILIVLFLRNIVTARGSFASISGRGGTGVISLGWWRHPARVLVICYLALSSVVPLVALLIVAFQPYWTPQIDFSSFTFDNFERMLFRRPISADAIRVSVTMGVIGGAIAMVVGLFVALIRRPSARGLLVGNFLSRVVDGATKLPAAFSGIVVAMGFVITFSGPPFNLSGTVALLMICYIVIFLPQASISAGAAVAQIGQEMTEASYVSGAGESRTLAKVTLPLAWPGLVSGWALLFVLIAGELEASSLLATSRTPVIGFVLADSWQNGSVSDMAAYATTFTAISCSVVLLLLALGRVRIQRAAARRPQKSISR